MRTKTEQCTADYGPTQSVTIIGKRWFNKRTGNTYHSVVALVNGKQAISIDYAYGYGDQYVDNALDALERVGFMPGRVKGETWHYFADRGIKISYWCTDVSRKKDL